MANSPAFERALANLEAVILELEEKGGNPHIKQVRWRRNMVHLYKRYADNVRQQGIMAELFDHVLARHPRSLPWRPIENAIHMMALEGEAPDLAKFLPGMGGKLPSTDEELDRRANAYLETARRCKDKILSRGLLTRNVQANLVSRSALLMAVQLLAATKTKLPQRVLAPGASAGVDLRAHGYGYRFDGKSYGNPRANTVIDRWTCSRGHRSKVHRILAEAYPQICVEELVGCDLAPVDLATSHGRKLFLANIVATDLKLVQNERNALLDAENIPVEISEENLLTWLPRQLNRERRGTTTIIWSSMVEPYLNNDERAQLARAISIAGSGATENNPLYYAQFNFRFNPDGTVIPEDVPLIVQEWPGRRRFTVSTEGPDGSPRLPIDQFFSAAGILDR